MAVSFGKMITNGTARLNAWDGKQVEAKLNETTHTLLHEMHKELVKRSAVSGIIAQVSVAGINGSENRPYVSTYYVTELLARGNPTLDEPFVSRFLKQLETGIFRAKQHDLSPGALTVLPDYGWPSKP